MDVKQTMNDSGQIVTYSAEYENYGGQPVYTVEDCRKDPQFQEPYVDVDEWKDTPVRHRYVHGGFRGTQMRFAFYFPEKDKYQGHFFQRMMPVQGDETVAQTQEGEEDVISFSVLHGAAFIDTNMGGLLDGGGDVSLVYRCCGAAAEYFRVLAKEMYHAGRAFGYVFGGSGGSLKTISCLESTEGIWDGGVPFVTASPMAMPSVFTVRAHAMRILRHKLEKIKDAIEPGGSGAPYAELNEEEAAALKEAELMGFPMKTWCEYDSIGEGALPVLYPAIPQLDPTYFDDFWTKPGYLGTEENSSAVRDRIHFETVITSIVHPELGLMTVADTVDEKNACGVDEAWKKELPKGKILPAFVLEHMEVPENYAKGLTIRFLDGALEGQSFQAAWLGENRIVPEPDMSGRDLVHLMKKVQPGTRILLDNSNYIAVQTYHRHQVPGPEYHPWDQFREENGNPVYPQRDVMVGPILAVSGAGAVQSGNVHGKVIILESLMDESAFPWQADWYRGAIVRAKGLQTKEAEDAELRLYYMENCMHTDCEEGNGGDHQHIVSYLGALYQALLDLSDWVEKGIAPAASSSYSLNGGQVLVSDRAAERKGVQPIVTLTAESVTGKKAGSGAGYAIPEGKLLVKTGEPVKFRVEVQLPEGAGTLEEVTWSFEGTDDFVRMEEPGESVVQADGTGMAVCECSYTFTHPGTYFPVVRAASNRHAGDAFTRVRNLARIRIIAEKE